jgi:hypothetical protein
MLLTTLEYGYICLVCYWLHWSTDIFVLYGTDYTGVQIHLSCMLLTTLYCIVPRVVTNRTRQMCPYSSVGRNRTRQMYGHICLVYYWLHWSTDIFFLYVTDYTGVRIHLSCTVPDYTGILIHLSCPLYDCTEVRTHLLNRTRQMCLYFSAVIYRTRQMYQYSSVVRNSTRQMYPYSSVVSNLQDKCICTPV